MNCRFYSHLLDDLLSPMFYKNFTKQKSGFLTKEEKWWILLFIPQQAKRQQRNSVNYNKNIGL